MTTTTTAEQTATAGPNTSRGGDLATTGDTDDLAVQSWQSTWTPKQLAVLRQIGIEEATQEDVDLFFHVCKMSGLDPFRREIYMIGRKTKVTVREVNPDTGNERSVEQYVMKFTHQTGINGFRKRAREIAERKGIRLGFDGPQWCGEDGVWRDVWPEGNPPVAAKFTVFRDGEPISFVAHYAEYVQTSGTPVGPNSMWAKMPRNQTGKCAEVGAIQRAFPDELGGLLFEDAAQGDIIDSAGNVLAEPARREPRRGRGVAALAARAAQVAEAEPGQGGGNEQQEGAEPSSGTDLSSPAADQDSATLWAPATRKKWLNRMFQLLTAAEVTDRDKQLIVIAGLAGRPVHPLELEHRDDINDTELRDVVNALNKAEKNDTLIDDVQDILLTAASHAATE